MKLLARSLFAGEAFKEFDDREEIEINKYIFKLSFEEDVKVVEVNGQIININENINEVIFSLFRDKGQNLIKISAKYIEEGRKKIKDFIIKCHSKSTIVDSAFLEDLKRFNQYFLHEIDSSKHSYTEIDYSQLWSNKGERQNEQEFIKGLKEIVKIIYEIAEAPKIKLIEEEVVVDSRESKKINSNSLTYFTQHPEHWYKERFLEPKPLKILTETFKEDMDIYENQFVKYIISKCVSVCKRKISDFKNINLDYVNRISLLTTRIQAEEGYVMDEGRQNIDILSNEKKDYEKFEIECVNLNSKFIRAEKYFKEIKYVKNLKIKITPKILYDKRYFKLFNLYSKLKNYIESKETDINKNHEEYYYHFILTILVEMKYVMHNLKFDLVESEGVVKKDNFLFESSSKVTMRYIHRSEKESIEAKIETCDFTHDLYGGKVIIELINNKNLKKSRVIICPNIHMGYTLSNDYINELKEMYSSIYDNGYGEIYNENKEYEIDSTYVFNNLSISQLIFDSEVRDEDRYKSLFYLSNLGDNFFNSDDYDKFGSFRVGMVPFKISDFSYIQKKLCNLFRIHLFEIGLKKYCTFCGSESVDVNESKKGALYRCNYCKKRWAENSCPNNDCNGKIIKFLSKDNAVSNIEDCEPHLFHVEYERKRNFIGACYDKNSFYDNSGGFCSKCGACFKNKKECVRCKIINKDINK